MKILSDTLLGLAALITVISALFGWLLQGHESAGEQTAGDFREIPISEHRLGMHGYDAPVHEKKAITIKESASTEQTDAEPGCQDITTTAASTEQDAASTELTATEQNCQDITTTAASAKQDAASTELTATEQNCQDITTAAASTEQTAASTELTATEQNCQGITTAAASTEQTAASTEQAAASTEQDAASTEQNTQLTDTSTEEAGEAALSFAYSSTGSLLEEVNSLRAAYGLSPLADDSLLDAAAAQRAVELTVCMSHTRPDGRPASSIISDYGISCSFRGENIAAGYALSGSVLKGWEESPSHLENLLNPVFTRAGISHTVTSAGYLDYWVILLSD